MSFKIESANLSHSKNIWKWRNDPITRSVCRNTDEVSWEDHDSWFNGSLENPDRYFYIGVSVTPENETPIGVIRFDVSSSSPEHCEVSINIAPSARGKQFGYLLLREGTQRFAGEISRPIRIFAEVKTDNLASMRLFASAGYSPCDDDSKDFNRYFLDIL
jgi:UDP-2,4-diacetamido-2,4,6-trideoxy-beta-L-altropyranose hydrolase